MTAWSLKFYGITNSIKASKMSQKHLYTQQNEIAQLGKYIQKMLFKKYHF